MKRWFAFQLDGAGAHCVGEVWATDAEDAYARAASLLRCRVDFLSETP